MISSDGKIDKDIEYRLGKANCAFDRLQKRVWKNKHLKNATKISVYKAVVLTTLLYGSESWVFYQHHIKLLERFHQRCLRTIFNIKWFDLVPNFDVLKKAKISCIETLLLKSQLRWAGHVTCMQDYRLPKIALYGELSNGHREVGAPKKRYKDLLKNSLQTCNIDHHKLAETVSDRVLWRQKIHQATSSFDQNHISRLV